MNLADSVYVECTVEKRYRRMVNSDVGANMIYTYTGLVAEVFPLVAPPDLVLADESKMIEVLSQREYDSVLELGSGYGRLMGHLQKVSQHVFGIEASEEMVSAGNRFDTTVALEVDNTIGNFLDSSTWPNHVIDCVVCSDGTINLVSNCEQLKKMLAFASGRISHGGGLLFSFISDDGWDALLGERSPRCVPANDRYYVMNNQPVRFPDQEKIILLRSVEEYYADGRAGRSSRVLQELTKLDVKVVCQYLNEIGFREVDVVKSDGLDIVLAYL